MPDIDVDFDSARRDEIIDFIYKRFGHEHVAMVATVNTMTARSAVRVVARVVRAAHRRGQPALAPPAVGRRAQDPRGARHLPGVRAPPAARRARWGMLLDLAEQLDHCPMHLGTHLGGFIITRDPIASLDAAAVGGQGHGRLAVRQGRHRGARPGEDGHPGAADALGDQRGGRAGARAGGRRRGAGAVRRCPRTTRASTSMIAAADTVGMFQLESSGQRNLVDAAASRPRSRTSSRRYRSSGPARSRPR